MDYRYRTINQSGIDMNTQPTQRQHVTRGSPPAPCALPLVNFDGFMTPRRETWPAHGGRSCASRRGARASRTHTHHAASRPPSRGCARRQKRRAGSRMAPAAGLCPLVTRLFASSRAIKAAPVEQAGRLGGRHREVNWRGLAEGARRESFAPRGALTREQPAIDANLVEDVLARQLTKLVAHREGLEAHGALAAAVFASRA